MNQKLKHNNIIGRIFEKETLNPQSWQAREPL